MEENQEVDDSQKLQQIECQIQELNQQTLEKDREIASLTEGKESLQKENKKLKKQVTSL